MFYENTLRNIAPAISRDAQTIQNSPLHKVRLLFPSKPIIPVEGFYVKHAQTIPSRIHKTRLQSSPRRYRTNWREWRASKKRLSISGPIAVNDMFLEVKRDSQLLEVGSQQRDKRRDSLKKSDKNIYGELKGKNCTGSSL